VGFLFQAASSAAKPDGGVAYYDYRSGYDELRCKNHQAGNL